MLASRLLVARHVISAALLPVLSAHLDHPPVHHYATTLPSLPTLLLQVLAPSARVNINSQVLSMYLDHLLPEIAAPGDDHNYGSSAMNDVTALQVCVLPGSCCPVL